LAEFQQIRDRRPMADIAFMREFLLAVSTVQNMADLPDELRF